MADDTPPAQTTSPNSPQPAVPAPPSPTRRPVYEPSLLPARKRRRASPWLVIPLLLVFLVGALYFFLVAPHQRRFVASAGRVAFASDQGSPGHSHLWISDADGRNSRRLTHAAMDETSPAFSPDGFQITYLAQAAGNPQVWVVDADGLNPQQITRNAGAKLSPLFAPSDNGLVAYSSGGVVSAIDTTSGDALRLLPPTPDAARAHGGDALINSPSIVIASFSWMPSQDRAAQGMAAVEETGDVQAFVLLPSLSGQARDTQSAQPGSPPLAAADAISLGWSPDGGLLAVAMLGVKGLPPGRELSAISLFDRAGNPVGQTPLAVTNSRALGPKNPVFSPDGKMIVFELWQQPDLAHARCVGLFAAPTDGSAPPHPVVRGDAAHLSFSPDGQSVYFLRVRPGGGHDFCRAASDGTGLARLSDGTADVSGFAVSPQKGGG